MAEPYYLTKNLSLTESQTENNTESIMHISSVKKNNSVISPILFLIFGVFSNTLALFVLNRSPAEQKRKLFFRLVSALAFTDLVGTTTTGPVVIAVYLNDFQWIGGTAMCKYCGIMMMFSGIATTTIVCIMAIERLFCIRFPYLYYAKLRKNHATVFLFSAWAFAGLIASLPLLGFGEIILQYPYTWCFFDYYTENLRHRAFNFLFATLILLSFSVTVTCNGIVLYTLCQRSRTGISRQNRGDTRTYFGYSRRYAECHMATLLIGITILFGSCYLPLMTRILIIQTKLVSASLRTDLLLFRFAALNQVLNPWVYILLRREVVWKVASTLKSVFSKPSRDTEVNRYKRQNSSASAIVTNNVQYSCCAFCWHCLTDPPQTHRPSSARLYSDYRRNYIYSSPQSSTNKLDVHVVRNEAISHSIEELSIDTNKCAKVLSELQRQACIDVDVVIQQPTTSKYTRMNLGLKGSSSTDCLESKIWKKLDDKEKCKTYRILRSSL